LLGNKIDTKIYVEKSPPIYGGANKNEKTDPLSTAEYKQRGPILIGV
jgi:hypothetical protein